MEPLQGGRENAIYRLDDKIIRPVGRWSRAVHQLLDFLEKSEFHGVPKVFGVDEQGNEVLSYVAGDVYNYPLSGNVATQEALTSAATLLRRYHDATADFLAQTQLDALEWMHPVRSPIEVICHGDFAPYNVALKDDTTVGLFDFDTAHPASRLWDVAYAVYCWAPFKTHVHDKLGDLESQSARAKAFCDHYGLTPSDRHNLVHVMMLRIQALVDFMHKEAEQGNRAFIDNIRDGHHLAYLADIDYLEENALFISKAVMGEDY